MRKKYFNPCVYTLSDPFTGQVKYVGSTSTRMCGKLATHLFDSKNRCSHATSKWIISLINKRSKPVIEVLEYCDKKEMRSLEKFYIQYLNFIGVELLNITHLKKPRRAKTLSIEHRKKLSLSKIGKANMKKRKKVGQFNMEGELIKTWEGVIHAEQQVKCSSISVVIKNHGRAAGYVWRYL